MDFVIIDIIFIGLICVMSIKGAFRGFVDEIFSLGSLFLSMLLSAVYYGELSAWIKARSSFEGGADLVSYLVLFVLIYLVLKTFQRLITKAIDETAFESVDRLLGFFFGILEGLLICFVVVYVLNFQTFFKIDDILKASRFIPYMERFMPALDEGGAYLFELINDKIKG